MIEFRFDVDDLAATWFRYSALLETVFSLRARSGPTKYPEQQPWIARWQSAYETLDTALLESLVTPRGWVPDFLTPRPLTPRPDFHGELARLAATPPERVGEDIRRAYQGDGSPVAEVLSTDEPSVLLGRIVEVLEAYWTRCLSPDWWPRARSVLEADIAHRGRMLSERGAEGLFGDLDARISWVNGSLRVTDPDPAVEALGTSVEVAGRGLVLIPTLFAKGALTEIAPQGPPVIAYPARGRATMAEGLGRHPRPEVPPALAELIGPPRARLLTMLDVPASTTELAHRLGVTPGAVSRHLGALAAAGLLERARHGRRVLYRRSPLGDSLALAGVTAPRAPSPGAAGPRAAGAPRG